MVFSWFWSGFECFFGGLSLRFNVAEAFLAAADEIHCPGHVLITKPVEHGGTFLSSFSMFFIFFIGVRGLFERLSTGNSAFSRLHRLGNAEP